MPASEHERFVGRLRWICRREGYRLSLSRRRNPRAADYEMVVISDANDCAVYVGHLAGAADFLGVA